MEQGFCCILIKKIPTALRKRLKVQAVIEDLTMNNAIVEAIRLWVEGLENKKS